MIHLRQVRGVWRRCSCGCPKEVHSGRARGGVEEGGGGSRARGKNVVQSWVASCQKEQNHAIAPASDSGRRYVCCALSDVVPYVFECPTRRAEKSLQKHASAASAIVTWVAECGPLVRWRELGMHPGLDLVQLVKVGRKVQDVKATLGCARASGCRRSANHSRPSSLGVQLACEAARRRGAFL